MKQWWIAFLLIMGSVCVIAQETRPKPGSISSNELKQLLETNGLVIINPRKRSHVPSNDQKKNVIIEKSENREFVVPAPIKKTKHVRKKLRGQKTLQNDKTDDAIIKRYKNMIAIAKNKHKNVYHNMIAHCETDDHTAEKTRAIAHHLWRHQESIKRLQQALDTFEACALEESVISILNQSLHAKTVKSKKKE